jgi:hypothetical protein
MMIMTDGGNISGVAWNDEGITDDFDNMGSMSTQFNAIRNEWGEHDCITEDTGTTVTFTTDDEPVLLTFDTQTNNFVPVVSELTNGTPNMFKRTLNVNGSDVTFVCDADGKVCYFNDGHFLVVENGDEITPSSDGAVLNALYTAAGGSVAVTATESSDTDMTKITNGNYFFVFNQDGYVTFGEITELFAFEDLEGKIIIPAGFRTINGQVTRDNETFDLNDVPVLVDKEGREYYLKCMRVSSVIYGNYFIANIPAYEDAIPGVWVSNFNSSIVGATDSNSADLKYDLPDEHWTWLFNHGLNPLIMQTSD